MAKGGFGVYARFTAPPGRREELVQALRAVLALGPNGATAVTVNTTADGADGVWVTETWPDRETHDRAKQVPAVVEASRRVLAAAAGPPTHEYGEVAGIVLDATPSLTRGPSPQMNAIVKRLEGMTGNRTSLSVEEHRTVHDAIAARQRVGPEIEVAAVDIGGVPVETVTAPGAGPGIVLYLHGGGFQAGSPAGRREFAARLSAVSGRRIVEPAYRLAPEHPFPAALEDVLTVYRALVDQPEPVDIAVGGDSFGGGSLALASLVAMRDSGLPLPSAGFALSPLTDLTLRSAGVNDPDGTDPFVTADSLREVVERYLAAGEDPADPMISPVFADLHGLPPLHIEVGSTERLYDDCRRLVAAARSAGVAASLRVTDGAVHIFPVAAAGTPEAEAALGRLAAFLSAPQPAP